MESIFPDFAIIQCLTTFHTIETVKKDQERHACSEVQFDNLNFNEDTWLF